MQQAMLLCNGVQTHVMTEGRWVEEGLAPGGHKDLVLVIPGNPGIPSFYSGFIKALKTRLPSETPVWVMGHAGHVQLPKHLSFSLPSEISQKELFGLDGQVKHKIEFVKKYIPRDAKLHIVAHSIGAWFTLKLLEDEEFAKNVVKCYFLFPTIEYMAETPSGKFLKNFVFRLAPVLLWMAWIFSCLPLFIKSIMVEIFGRFFGVTNKMVKPVLQLIDSVVLDRIIKLAKEELATVREMNHEVIARNSKKLFIYYGASDGWTPVSYYEKMKTEHPEVQTELCKRGFQHAFVLEHDREVGNMIGDMINKTIQSVEKN